MFDTLRKFTIRLLRGYRSRRQELFFGFGADCESDMIEAVIGRKPTIVSEAILPGYQLCIQSLEDIPVSGANPREILQRSWGNDFVSYTIRQNKEEQVKGTLFSMSQRERMMLDIWEMVPEGWQDSVVVRVKLPNGKFVRARTQRLPRGHNHGYSTSGLNYKPWLMPKADFLRIASQDAFSYGELI